MPQMIFRQYTRDLSKEYGTCDSRTVAQKSRVNTTTKNTLYKPKREIGGIGAIGTFVEVLGLRFGCKDTTPRDSAGALRSYRGVALVSFSAES
jgi:hypothetical protein